jgi:hypothetical protein
VLQWACLTAQQEPPSPRAPEFPANAAWLKGGPLKLGDLRKQFKFLGETGSYVFLYVVGEQVPPHEEWEASRKKA